MGDYDYVRKRKCSIDKSKCEKKKRKIVPDPCYSDDCKKCNQTTQIEDYLLSSLNYECKSNKPKDDCPPIKITPIPTDKSLDVSFYHLWKSKEEKKSTTTITKLLLLFF